MVWFYICPKEIVVIVTMEMNVLVNALMRNAIVHLDVIVQLDTVSGDQVPLLKNVNHVRMEKMEKVGKMD
jgi:hypothetical protein